MTKKQRAKLRAIVGEIIQELRQQGRFSTKALVEEVIDRYPQLVEETKDQLVKEALASWARKHLKSEDAELKSPQFTLPIELAGLKLPSAISVRHDEEDEEAPLWTPIEDATFDDLEINVEMLQNQVSADMRKLKNLRQLHRYLAPLMADERRTEPIGKVLAECANRGEQFTLLG